MPNLKAVGPDQPDHGGSSDRADADVRALRGDLVRATAQRGDTVVLAAALQLVTVLTKGTVDGADGVSVTLPQHGRMMTMASTDDTIRRMDHHQYETGEGPCLAAAAESRPFHAESLAEETRWPAFVPRARQEGIASILSTPLTSVSGPLGALNIYSNTVRAFGPHQQMLAFLLADHVAGLLLETSERVTDAQLAARINDALVAREVIAQAQGVYMARQRMSPVQAAAALHRDARAADLTVAGLATTIVRSTHRMGSTPERSRDV